MPSQSENQWIVRILDDRVWLNRPYKFRRPSEWAHWGRMQADLLLNIRKEWPNTHIDLRVQTYVLDYYTKLLKPSSYEQISGSSKAEYVLLIPDCHDQVTLAGVLAGAGLVPLSKGIFILERAPSDWHNEITNLFEIARKLSKGQHVSAFHNELSRCRCLCYSMDEDLIIAKLDFTESQLLSLLQSTGQNESLDLVIIRKSQNAPKPG